MKLITRQYTPWGIFDVYFLIILPDIYHIYTFRDSTAKATKSFAKGEASKNVAAKAITDERTNVHH